MQPRLQSRLALGLFLLLLPFQTSFGEQLELITRSVRPATLASGDSMAVQLSADGNWALFLSNADNLVPGDHNMLYVDVFLKNLVTGELELLSANTAGSGGNGNSAYASFSSNAEVVVFQSDASDLVPGDTNGVSDVFLWERSSNTLRLVSRTEAELGNGPSGFPSISPDGRLVLFESAASNLVTNDSNGSVDVFMLNRETGSFELITLDVNGAEAARGRLPDTILGGHLAVMSENGEYVAFISAATNLVGTTVLNTERHVYVRDRVAGETMLASDGTNVVAKASTEMLFSADGSKLAFPAGPRLGNQPRIYLFAPESGSRTNIPLPTGVSTIIQGPDSPSISADGQFIAYRLNDLIYLWGVAAQTNILLTGTTFIAPGGPSQDPIITPDGAYVFFLSAATNLQQVATHGLYQLFRYERTNRTLQLISAYEDGSAWTSEMLYPSISADGQTIAFEMHDGDLVPGDDNNAYDVFVLNDDGIQVISTADQEVAVLAGNGASRLGPNALSWDGRYLVFSSSASDLVENDTNDAEDVFLHDLRTGSTTLLSVDLQGVQGNGRSFAPAISADGNWVAFLSYANNLAPDDTNNNVNVFVKHNYIGGMPSGSVQMLKPSSSLVPVHRPPAISVDGSVVAYQATQNGAPATSSTIFAHDLLTGELVSMPLLSSLSVQTAEWVLSPDGQWIVGESSQGLRLLNTSTGPEDLAYASRVVPLGFSDDGTKLVALQITPLNMAVRLVDFDSRQFTHAFSNSLSGVVSPDGRFLAHQQQLSTGTGPANFGLAIANLELGTNHSIFPLVEETNSVRMTDLPVFSRDGRWLTFSTRSTNVLASDQDGMTDTYLFDAVTRQVKLVSATSAGDPANAPSGNPIISRRGDFIVFESSATDLLENDGNSHSDIYLARLSSSDSDNDGLDDGYEVIFFGSYKQTGDGDADGDGMTNAAEIEAGTNPNDAGSVLLIHTERQEAGLVLRFPTVPGHRYRLQRKESVDGEWSHEGGTVVATSSELEFLVEIVNEHRFYRLELEL